MGGEGLPFDRGDVLGVQRAIVQRCRREVARIVGGAPARHVRTALGAGLVRLRDVVVAQRRAEGLTPARRRRSGGGDTCLPRPNLITSL